MKVNHQHSDSFTLTKTNTLHIVIVVLETISQARPLFFLQVLQETFCHSARPEPSLWSITEPKNFLLLTRGSCQGFILQPIASIHPISILSFTGTWAVSWVRQLSVAPSLCLAVNENNRCLPFRHIYFLCSSLHCIQHARTQTHFICELHTSHFIYNII